MRPGSSSGLYVSTRLVILLIGLVVVQLFPVAANAQAFVPDHDSTVIDILPKAIVALSVEMRLRESRIDAAGISAAGTASAATGGNARSEGEGNQAQNVLRQALSAYQIAITDQDPRAYGYTLTVLKRWPNETPKPPLIHILTAAVLQHGHEFQRALQELDSALLVEPDNVQALLIKAQISLVIADYEMARQSCEALWPLVRSEVALNCQAQLESLTGQAQASFEAVSKRLAGGAVLNPQDSFELNTTAATIAHRLGNEHEAEHHYLSALQLSPTSGYLLVHYGSFLLEAGRPEDVLSLLRELPADSMSTELKIVQAEAMLAATPGDPALRELTAELQAFFQAAFLREEAPHKEYAQYALSVLMDAQSAMESARENWMLQKEPSDTLLLARAASASGNAVVLDDIARWIYAAGTEDVRLAAVLSQGPAPRGRIPR